ncbi:MAG: hypothetical protein LQ338_001337 [Usnochroma carphineum]|nr:MAG: hypothetical protein LQ338_001337 [Usnochroma carphineum]
MPTSTSTCEYGNCSDHFHTEGLALVDGASEQRSGSQPVEQPSITSIDHIPNKNVGHQGTMDAKEKEKQGAGPNYDPNDRGLRRIIRNFTPSMSAKRRELEEMTAMYLIPIVAVVIVATSGGLVAGAIHNQNHQLWTLVISFVFWGIGSPLSWIILTLYFLRMTTHKPLKREVIVSLLLPMGPLGLSAFL